MMAFRNVAIGLLLACYGCCINIGTCRPHAEHERTVQLSAPFEPGSTFQAQTHNGSITVTGADVPDCNLTASIIARSDTVENAKILAEAVKITLVPSANTLIAKVETPTLRRFSCACESVDAAFDVALPNKTNLNLSTHNGAITVVDVTGGLKASTHNGSLNITGLDGNIEAATHNGDIICKHVTGDTILNSHNGSVNVSYAPNTIPVRDISIQTHNGAITLTPPPDYSAAVEAETHNGPIYSDLPITIVGTVGKNKITGYLGTGQGKLSLRTHNGTIKIQK